MTFVPVKPAAGPRFRRARAIAGATTWVGGATAGAVAWWLDHPSLDVAIAVLVFVAYLVMLGAVLAQRPPQIK